MARRTSWSHSPSLKSSWTTATSLGTLTLSSHLTWHTTSSISRLTWSCPWPSSYSRSDSISQSPLRLSNPFQRSTLSQNRCHSHCWALQQANWHEAIAQQGIWLEIRSFRTVYQRNWRSIRTWRVRRRIQGGRITRKTSLTPYWSLLMANRPAVRSANLRNLILTSVISHAKLKMRNVKNLMKITSRLAILFQVNYSTISSCHATRWSHMRRLSLKTLSSGSWQRKSPTNKIDLYRALNRRKYAIAINTRRARSVKLASFTPNKPL